MTDTELLLFPAIAAVVIGILAFAWIWEVVMRVIDDPQSSRLDRAAARVLAAALVLALVIIGVAVHS